MMRVNRGVLRLMMALGLLLASAASLGDSGEAVADRLVIDPGTFDSLPAAGAEKTLERGARGLGHTGPRIRLWQPDSDAVFAEGEAVAVHVEFLPAADGTAPDMATLKIKVRKGFFGRDITEAVEPYVEGTAIRVPTVDFSDHTGKFRFEIRIRDYRNRESKAEFRVNIRT